MPAVPVHEPLTFWWWGKCSSIVLPMPKVADLMLEKFSFFFKSSSSVFGIFIVSFQFKTDFKRFYHPFNFQYQQCLDMNPRPKNGEASALPLYYLRQKWLTCRFLILRGVCKCSFLNGIKNPHKICIISLHGQCYIYMMNEILVALAKCTLA